MAIFLNRVRKKERLIAWAMLLLYVLPIGFTGRIEAQDIVVDGSALESERAQVENSTQGGVKIVNIASSSEGGVSKNKFNDYNVGQSGVIINNEAGVQAQTQLAGNIYGNDRLNGKSAKVVLFEVNGGRKSLLEGITEMAGSAADFVLSNEAGVYVNGAGFLNIPKVTLTTGKRGDDGVIEVKGGEIEIGEKGMWAGQYLELISKIMTVRGRVDAEKEILGIVGLNRV